MQVERAGVDMEEVRKMLEQHDAEVRARAIDEFAERLQDKVESFQTEINGFRADVLTLDYFVEFVDEIAEQLKAGGKDE